MDMLDNVTAMRGGLVLEKQYWDNGGLINIQRTQPEQLYTVSLARFSSNGGMVWEHQLPETFQSYEAALFAGARHLDGTHQSFIDGDDDGDEVCPLCGRDQY